MQFVDGHENQDASEEFGESAEPVHVIGRVPQGLTSDISRFSLPDPAHQILYPCRLIAEARLASGKASLVPRNRRPSGFFSLVEVCRCPTTQLRPAP